MDTEENKFNLIIGDKNDLAHISAHCECGSFDFEGDWDDLCSAWPSHVRDPEFTHLYIEKSDHESLSLLSRADGRRFMEITDPDNLQEYDDEIYGDAGL